MATNPTIPINRTQTGVRMDRRLVLVLDELARGNLGLLMEDIVLHAFDGANAFSPKTLATIIEIKHKHGMDFDFPDRGEGQAHATGKNEKPVAPDRVQAGFRLETRLLKTLKALAEREDMGLGELLEEIAYHQLVGAKPFTRKTLAAIALLKQVYDVTYDVHDTGNFIER